MDKVRKLRRYGRKDYSLVVDFPVEIVGRDGVVRRYSFEESIRLYQRRIASANTRYQDSEVALAEVAHCQRRIEQLRRSYFARYGWTSLLAARNRRLLGDELAGEVAAFLRRFVEGTELDPESFRLTQVEAGPEVQVYFAQRMSEDGEARDALLLYLYSFENPDVCPTREGFFTFLKVLQGVRHVAEGVETLLAFHHTADCGLILTGRKGEGLEILQDVGEGMPGLELPWLESRMSRPDPLKEANIHLRQGRVAEALGLYQSALEDNPYRRVAYLGAAVCADLLGADADAETAALMGTRYFPEDPHLWDQLAVARLRLGDRAGAAAACARVAALEGESDGSRLVGAVLALERGRPLLARGVLRGTADPDLDKATRNEKILLVGWVCARLALGAVAALALSRGGWFPGGVGALGALGALIAAELLLRRYVAQVARGNPRWRLARVSALLRAVESVASTAQ